MNARRTAPENAAALIAVETVLAAVATAWALGIVPELISAGMDTFAVDVAGPVGGTPHSTK